MVTQMGVTELAYLAGIKLFTLLNKVFGQSIAAVATPTPAPTPSLREGLDPLDVSPGVLGFLVTFVIAGVLILLGLSMTKRLRRIRHRAEKEAQAEHGGTGGSTHA